MAAAERLAVGEAAAGGRSVSAWREVRARRTQWKVEKSAWDVT